MIAKLRQFYHPAMELLGPLLTGFIFEQEYLTKQDRPPVTEMAETLDGFFRAIPRDSRYHLELRTELYLREPIFEVLEKYGVGQVLSHWTWLPPLRKQLAKAGGKFFNAGNQNIIRLLTPLGMKYEDSYTQAFPFDKLVEGMLRPEMILETVDIYHCLDRDRSSWSLKTALFPRKLSKISWFPSLILLHRDRVYQLIWLLYSK